MFYTYDILTKPVLCVNKFQLGCQVRMPVLIGNELRKSTHVVINTIHIKKNALQKHR